MSASGRANWPPTPESDVEPYYVPFEDFTHVKFYRRSLYDGVLLQGARFDGFSDVDDWAAAAGHRHRPEPPGGDRSYTPHYTEPRRRELAWIGRAME